MMNPNLLNEKEVAVSDEEVINKDATVDDFL